LLLFDSILVIVQTTTRFRQVLAIAEHGSFRRAAAALKISQPALTKSVRALEAELGVRLFDRQPRAVTLTQFGKRVVAHSKGLVAAEEDLLHDLALLAGLEKGSVRVAMGPYPSVISGYAAAAKLIGQHPKLAVALSVAGWRAVTSSVAQGQVDLGIAELADAVENDALATEVVGEHRARIFCRPGHPILERERVLLRDLLAFPWVNTRIPSRIASLFPRPLGRAGSIDESTGDMIPAVEFDVPMQLAAFGNVSDTLVFGVLGLVEGELDAGTLAVVPAPEPEMRAQYGFIWLKHRSLSPGARAFMQAVRDQEVAFVEREARLAKLYC
jgi:DNA-binding transcriptional LysR family regulator